MARGRKLERLEDFQRALKNHYGLGSGKDYKPWIRVQDVSSQGNSSKIQGIKTGREHHLLSENETCFFYLAEFCSSVIDIREQFPLLPLDATQRVAATLAVPHPAIPTSKHPNVMTTDFLLTLKKGDKVWYEAISVKPFESLLSKRCAEKLDIERVFWQLLGVRYHIFVRNELQTIKARNIEWATWPIRHGFAASDNTLDYLAAHIEPGSCFIVDLCDLAVKTLSVGEEEALGLIRALIGSRRCIVDLDIPISESGALHIKEVIQLSERSRHAS